LSDWEKVWDRIFEKYGHYSGVHTINNAALVVMGLTFGSGDYENGIVVTVRGGWDTDCNGATVGSILGAKFGAGSLPDKWIGVLSDRLMSVVRDCNDNRISELADRTHRLARRMMEPSEDEDEAGPVVETAEVELRGKWALNVSFGKQVLTVNDDWSGQLEMTAFGEIAKVRNIRVERNKVSFVYGVNKGEMVMDIEFQGTIKGDRLTGLCSSNGHEFEMSGVRI
ncbi:MAG: ADP-ribosylglycohydrolase family protein, partial [Gammaproteobacteria bacterium]|nr:ADP-ribosylglycohydrolase family protein [Gammaproteobacteria bacterium]